MNDWFYADSSQRQHGPVTAEALNTLRLSGQADWNTLIWREGMVQWEPMHRHAHIIAPGVVPVIPPPVQPVIASGSPHSARVPDVVYAGFWRRVAAYLLDSLMVGVVCLFIQVPLFIASGLFSIDRSNPANITAGMWLAILLAYLVPIALQVAYYAWFHSREKQATLGKQAVGIKVTGLGGERISLARGIGRHFALVLSALTFGIGYIMAAFTERKQALHDMLASTYVVDQYAYTPHAELQEQGLGTATKVILMVFGGLYFLVFVVACAMGMAAAAHS